MNIHEAFPQGNFTEGADARALGALLSYDGKLTAPQFLYTLYSTGKISFGQCLLALWAGIQEGLVSISPRGELTVTQKGKELTHEAD